MNPVRIHEGAGPFTTELLLWNCAMLQWWEMDSLQLLTLYLAPTPLFSGRKAKINLHTTPKWTVVISIGCLLPCAVPEIFVMGGGGGGRGGWGGGWEGGWGGGVGSTSIWQKKKTLWQRCLFVFVFCFFLSPRLILQKSNGQFQREISFFKAPEGVQIFPGGGGGGNCLLPIETQITCNFPGDPDPLAPPLWIRTWLRSI